MKNLQHPIFWAALLPFLHLYLLFKFLRYIWRVSQREQ